MLPLSRRTSELLASLHAELAWLERCHPEKRALIALARAHLSALDSALVTPPKEEQPCDPLPSAQP